VPGARGSIVTAVVELAGHSRLSEHYRMLHGRTRLYLNLTATVGYEHDAITATHAELADAIRAGDAALAERLGAAHNTADGEHLVALLSQEEGC
jgi:DNA-binding GntR family transcriptional regulator